MAPTVIQRSSSLEFSSRRVMAWGSSKTRTAVSNRTSCLRRFWRFLVFVLCKSHGSARNLAYLLGRAMSIYLYVHREPVPQVALFYPGLLTFRDRSSGVEVFPLPLPSSFGFVFTLLSFQFLFSNFYFLISSF